MRKSRFSETQIVRMLKDAEAGRPASDICCENGINSTTFYKWKAKYGGMEASDVRRLKELESGHSRLKQMFADLSLEKHGVKLEFIQPGKPTQNSYVERFNRTFRHEVLDFYVFGRLSEVREIVEDWLKQYNEQRPHESLGDLTPSEYLAINSPEASTFDWH